MNISHLLDTRLTAAMRALGLPETAAAQVKPAANPDFGDYQANGVMSAAKQLKINPRELAQQILAQADLSDIAAKAEVAGPGFINIFISPEWMASQILAIAGPNSPLIQTADPAQTVVVDYSGPNLAKEMHVGHLRSTIIGDAVANILGYQGHRIIRQNHVGDWGTQFGMLIAQLEQLQTRDPSDDAAPKLADLEAFYRQAKQNFDADPDFAALAREYVVRLQSGDAQCLTLWQQFIDISLRHCEDVYHRLGVKLTRGDVKAESAYNADLPQVVADLRAQGLLTEDQGAQCAFLPELANKDGSITPIIVQKSDGGYLYATTDLAALRHRNAQLKAKRILYFVDARQGLHFQQMFALARKAGFVDADVELEHCAFGSMLGDDGKPFKTRTGGTVKLVDLLQEAEQRAFTLISEKNPDVPETERREMAHKIGIGAVKYSDLSKNRISDYVFNWDAMLNFEGNTAPYLQYAYVRISRILTAMAETETPPKFEQENNAENRAELAAELKHPVERALALTLLQFGEKLHTAGRDSAPHILCAYLYDLSGAFMRFYENCPILKEGVTENQRRPRLLLAQLTARTLKVGLGLLGIETLERM